MSNKKRKRPPQQRQQGPAPTTPSTTPPKGGANVARRERKELARQAREQERRRAARRAANRRAVTFLVIGALGLSVFWFLNRAAGSNPIPEAAKQAAAAAGCSEVQTPVENPQSGTSQHLDPGQPFTYDQKPATSGMHSPSPYPATPHVYTTPLDETQAVHSLEHSQVIVYYRANGEGALAQPSIDRLTTSVNASANALLAPYPDLPAGTSIALAAWNKLQTCPGTNDAGTAISPDDAGTIADGFIQAFACTGNAPEPKADGNGC